VLNAYFRLLTNKLAASVETAVSRIDHNGVIKDLTGRADLDGSYLLLIVFSCLVALLGLLVNSVAVVIGAMLISPLMGPIFTAALSFSLGDLRLARKALQMIVVSIILSVLVSAIFTFLSPLKAPTQEILSRTRPNIYDLLIAAFAGAAGAYALCTRVSYLFVTTGVAVATAVIPPLSVVGYGIGTGQAAIALGGFLLFFTNLVAIVISSDIVFYIFKFRASMVEEIQYPVRKRVQILGGVLVLISVPLVYTLVTDIKKVKLTNRIETVLKGHLNSKDHSRMTDFSLNHGNDGLTVSASVNTVRFYNVSTEKRIENDLKTALKGPVRLDLEQVIVRSSAVEPLRFTPINPLGISPLQQPEPLAKLREKAIRRVKSGCDEAQPFVSPYTINQCSIRFSDKGSPTTVVMTIGRDYSFSEDERRWLRIMLEKKLGEPIELELETVPFLPPIHFGNDGNLDDASRKALLIFRQFSGIEPKPWITIIAPHVTRRKSSEENLKIATLKEYLVKDIGIPITRVIRGQDEGPDLRVRVEPLRK